jgi:FkbM family methyltransferase
MSAKIDSRKELLKKLKHATNALTDIGIFWQSTGAPSNPNETGEKDALEWVFKKLIKKDYELCIFDIGGHVGEWTRIANNTVFSSEIHVFEPARESREILEKRCVAANGNTIRINPKGVAATPADAEFYIPISGGPLSHSSMILENIKSLRGQDFEIRKVECTSISKYCQEISIEKIDYLKIDVEGMEYAILNSLSSDIKNKINFIQFEFNDTYLSQRLFFKDFWNFLQEDFYVLRITNKGLIKFHEYIAELLELTGMANYLCVRKNQFAEIDKFGLNKNSLTFIPF